MILITGASGFIGNKLYHFFKCKEKNVKGTFCTNTGNIISGDRIYLNIADDKYDDVLGLNDLSHVILSHGISNIEKCGMEPGASRRINVLNTIGLLNALKQVNRDIVPVFFSTSMIYTGNSEYPDESDEPAPLTQYGKQKYEIEQYIMGNFGKYIILRLTKVYDVKQGDGTIFTSWLDSLRGNVTIRAASDIFISPVFADDVTRALCLLIENNHSGIYNLGGDYISSPYDLAGRLADYFHLDPGLINRVSIGDFHFKEPRPKYNSVDPGKIKKLVKFSLTDYRTAFRLIGQNYGKGANYSYA